MFAALLLSARALCDRIGARQSFGAGPAVFVAASAACGLAPGLGVLVAAPPAQGAGAAVMLPASLALIREAYSDARTRARAIAIWSLGANARSRSYRLARCTSPTSPSVGFLSDAKASFWSTIF